LILDKSYQARQRTRLLKFCRTPPGDFLEAWFPPPISFEVDRFPFFRFVRRWSIFLRMAFFPEGLCRELPLVCSLPHGSGAIMRIHELISSDFGPCVPREDRMKCLFGSSLCSLVSTGYPPFPCCPLVGRYRRLAPCRPLAFCVSTIGS